MKTKLLATLLLGAALFSSATSVRAGEQPPTDSKPLSEILKALEAQDIGTITEAEFEDGFWEVKVHKGTAWQKLYLNPRTGDEQRRHATDYDDVPPADSKLISAIVEAVEARELGTITEAEFDDGVWEVELRKNGTKNKLKLDPATGDPIRY